MFIKSINFAKKYYMIKTLIFDWGDTIMRDYPHLKTPMYTWDHVEYIPEVEKTLELLYNNYIMVIATNAGQSDTNDMIKALKRINANKYFNYFFSSKDLGYEKPDKLFFKTIINNLGFKANECVMIGNIYEKDIIGAKDIGMNTILYNEKDIKGNYQKADFIVNKMYNIICIIENLDYKKHK